MASFPLSAQAEGPSQYETEIPDVPNEKPPKKQENIKDPDAGTSKTNDGGSGVPDNSETGEDGESSEGGGVGGGQGSGDGSGGAKSGDGGSGQGSPGNGSSGGSKTSVGQLTPVSNQQPADDGGSSPLVPILIAIAALAAISIGAVVIRQRRQRRGPGTQVSPKAS